MPSLVDVLALVISYSKIHPDHHEADDMSENEATATHPPSLTTAQIGWVFLQVGMTAFGGLGATVALMCRELV